jgi:tetratricopeptide (TPR) repeat protein
VATRRGSRSPGAARWPTSTTTAGSTSSSPNGHVYPQVDSCAPSDIVYRETNLLFRGLPGETPRFENASATSGEPFTVAGPHRGSAAADLDEDGDLDLVIVRLDETPLLAWNETAPRGHWLSVLPELADGRRAIGAQVVAEAGGRRWVGESRAGSSFLSSEDPRVHVGLGDRAVIDRLSVRFPDGATWSASDRGRGPPPRRARRHRGARHRRGPGRQAMRSRWIAALGFTLLAVAPLRAQEGLEQALQLRRSGQAEASLALVEARLAAAPFDQRLQGLRGLLLLDLGRDREAAELAASLSGYAGGEFRVHCFLGRAALAQGESEAAIAHLKRALECNPKAIEPATILVQAQIAAGKLRAAIAGAEALEAVAPELGRKLGAQALVAQARRHRERGEEVTPLAVDDFKRALEKQPGDLSIVRLLVDTLIDLSFTDEARTLVEQHFGQQRDGVDWHYYMGRCHAARLELAAAEADLRAVIALQPHHVAALLELSKLALDDGRRSRRAAGSRSRSRSSRARAAPG